MTEPATTPEPVVFTPEHEVAAELLRRLDRMHAEDAATGHPTTADTSGPHGLDGLRDRMWTAACANEGHGDRELFNGLFEDAVRAAMAVRDAPADQHMPVVAPLRDGAWGVHCLACSTTAGDYVYPCRDGRDFPPTPLVNAAARHAELRQQIGDEIEVAQRKADAEWSQSMDREGCPEVKKHYLNGVGIGLEQAAAITRGEA